MSLAWQNHWTVHDSFKEVQLFHSLWVFQKKQIGKKTPFKHKWNCFRNYEQGTENDLIITCTVIVMIFTIIIRIITHNSWIKRSKFYTEIGSCNFSREKRPTIQLGIIRDNNTCDVWKCDCLYQKHNFLYIVNTMKFAFLTQGYHQCTHSVSDAPSRDICG